MLLGTSVCDALRCSGDAGMLLEEPGTRSGCKGTLAVVDKARELVSCPSRTESVGVDFEIGAGLRGMTGLFDVDVDGRNEADGDCVNAGGGLIGEQTLSLLNGTGQTEMSIIGCDC